MIQETKSAIAAPQAVQQRNAPPENDHLLEKAKQFEAVFIAQMLNYSGLTKAIGQNAGFGGEAFSSMMSQQYAEAIVDDGGFGLAKKIYTQLLDQESRNDAPAAR